MYTFSASQSSSVLHSTTMKPCLRATASTPRVMAGKIRLSMLGSIRQMVLLRRSFRLLARALDW